MIIKTQLLTIFILMLSFNVTVGLRVNTDPTPENYSPQNYEQKLSSLQDHFNNSLQEIKQSIREINEVINNQNTSNNQKAVKLNQGIADERDQLYSIEQFLKLPFEEKLCQGQTVEPETRQTINEKLKNISISLENLEGALYQCQQDMCPRQQEIVMEIKQEENYVNILNQTINSKCKRKAYQFVEEAAVGLVDLSQNLKKDNLKAQNYFFGQLSPKIYQFQRFQYSTKYNLTSCPLQTPYVGDLPNKCFQCSEKGAMFNLQLRKCLSCNGLSFFNTSTSECQRCPNHGYYSLDENKCKQCQKGQFLNEQTIKCESCAKNQKFNQESYQCEDCEEDKYFNPQKLQCVMCNLQKGQFLNKTDFSCQLCPIGKFYSLTEKSCIDCPFPQYYNKTQGKCTQCPIETQFNLTTGLCVKCASDKFYDPKSNQCYACAPGEKYDIFQDICIDEGKEEPTVECPEDKPYYIELGKSCQKCPQQYYFKAEERRCVFKNLISFCPPEKPTYNPETLACE